MSETLDYRPSYFAAAVAAVLTFLLYLITLSPETAMWDTSEYIAAAYTLGLPHPPGNPFFVLVGRVFTILPIAPNVAMRVNLLAALSSAVSAGMWFLITERVLVGWFEKRWQRVMGGALAVLIGATAFTVWSNSVVNEKVYTFSLVGLAVCAWLIVRWCDEPDAPGANKLLILVAYLCGLGYANHMAGMLVAPAALIAVLYRKPAVLMQWRLIAACVGALILGATPFATQPIRAAHNPPINEGEPTACREGLKLSCTLSKGTYTAFMYNFNRGQYGKPSVTERMAPFTAQVGMWWLYFKWQWVRDAAGERPGLQGGLAAIFLLLGIIGGWVHYRRDPRSFAFFGPLMLTLTLGLIYYLNFRYGASQSPELGMNVDREVRDRDYFYLWSFSAWSVWAALGLVYVWESIAVVIGRERVTVGKESYDLPTNRGWALGAPILLIAFIPLVANWTAASRAGQTDTADVAIDMLNSVEPYGILVTVGDNDTFPLWYAQEVLGIRKDVTVANTSLLNTDWYTRQLIRREVFEYDQANGPAAFRDGEWTKPAGPILKMTLEDADLVPVYQELRTPQRFTKGELVATLEPQVLSRADILVLRMILDNDHRAVHFSRTSGGLAEQLGLREYVVIQGHTRKLLPRRATETESIVRVPGTGLVDVTRSAALWNEFRAPASLANRSMWVDQPSIGLPGLVVNTGIITAAAMERAGHEAAADSVNDQVRAIATAMGFADLVAQMQATRQPRIAPGSDMLQSFPVPGADSPAGRRP
ncbi:MAG: DUF2723 domain-containing protein [Gemmatimonadaceae bacterium]|nr:DUF2723 domain-containing protein [Gemmatimonadaceae bacterium]MCW5827393.1 DUF2723 domain-containing protein [Gemmatimonadaceae bacterium]